MRIALPIAAFAGLFLIICTVNTGRAAPQYAVHDLQLSADTFPYYMDLSDYGQLVGSTFSGAPFLWTPTSPGATTGNSVPLNTLPGFNHFATGINERGQIIGASNGQAVMWQPASPNGLPGDPIPLGSNSYFASGINEFGQIVGDRIEAGLSRAFLWTPQTPNGLTGSILTISTGRGHAINDRGQVTGVGGGVGVFLWQPTTPNATTGAFHNLNIAQQLALEGKINSHGSIAGSDANAFVWNPASANGTSGAVTPIPDFPDDYDVIEVNDFNDAGAVLGTSYGDGQPFRTWLWTQQDGLHDLNDLLDPASVAAGWTIQRSAAINNLGHIVAFATLDPPEGTDLNGVQFRVVMLTTVPEPSVGLLAALLSLFCRRRSTFRGR